MKIDKIFYPILLSNLFFLNNQTMEISTEGKDKMLPKEVSSLLKLTIKPLADNAVKIYDDNFKINSKNAFTAMEKSLDNINIPQDIIDQIYSYIITDLNRSDIFLRELMTKNHRTSPMNGFYRKTDSLSIFFNLCYNAL